VSNVYFISDLHLGHEGALKWARDFREGNNAREMNEWLVHQWNSVVKSKKDVVWVLGDVAMSLGDMHDCLFKMNGRKKLCLGSHDEYPLFHYLYHFEEVCAYRKYKGFWLSHMPIHEFDMVKTRVRGSIHGHLHQNKIDDTRYHNVCVEHCAGKPIPFKSILEYHESVNK